MIRNKLGSVCKVIDDLRVDGEIIFSSYSACVCVFYFHLLLLGFWLEMFLWKFYTLFSLKVLVLVVLEKDRI